MAGRYETHNGLGGAAVDVDVAFELLGTALAGAALGGIANGTTRIQIMNLDASNDAYWHIAAVGESAPASTATMAILPPRQIVAFNYSIDTLRRFYVSGGLNTVSIYVLQEGMKQ